MISGGPGEARTKLGTRARAALVPLVVLALGVALHLPYLARLGLWNDDVVMFLQPHHAAAGDELAYVLEDATAFLAGGERPASYPPYALARLAYVAGPAWLHLFAVVCAALAAALFARFVRRLVVDEGAALAAGALALLWPLSPLVLFWPSTIHFTVAAGLSILAAEAALAGRPRAVWVAASWHLLACLTLEVFLFAAPLWALVAYASERWGLAPRSAALRGAVRSVGAMLAVSGAVIAWRLAVLPRLGIERLGYEGQIVPVAAALEQLVRAPGALFWPWPRALAAGREIAAGHEPLGLAAVLAAAVAMLAFALGSKRSGSPAGDPPPAAPERRRALLAWIPGTAMALAWSAQLAFVPGTFGDPAGLPSRLDYPVLFAVAASLAGVYRALTSVGAGQWRFASRIAAGVLLFLALLSGVRFHGQVARAHVRDGMESEARMEQIALACGSLAPGTLVIVDTPWPSELLRMGKGGMSHHVLSSLLVVRYDDPTLRGVRLGELRVIPGAVRPLDFGDPATWFHDGDYGPIYLEGRDVAEPVAFDRLVTLGSSIDGRLTEVPSLTYSITRDRRGELWSVSERCGAAATPPSAAFCHAFPRACRPTRG